jgi:hypothetical protein
MFFTDSLREVTSCVKGRWFEQVGVLIRIGSFICYVGKKIPRISAAQVDKVHCSLIPNSTRTKDKT